MIITYKNDNITEELICDEAIWQDVMLILLKAGFSVISVEEKQ